MQYDYMIVGQGLAGSCMAQQLLRKGKSIVAIDNPHPNTSSMVAAGLFNPITGRKMVKSWRADDLFPYLHVFYEEMEKELKVRFSHSVNIYRPFLDLEMQNEWMGKSISSENEYFIEKVYHQSRYPEDLFDEYGGLEMKNSGYVDLPEFIKAVRTLLKKDARYILEEFEESKITIEEDCVKYNGIESKKVIFCNGRKAAESKLFGWLPFSLVKGEILEVSVSRLPNVIYNRGVFILPKKDGTCRVGATYERNDLSYNATEKGRQALVDKLNALYKSDYDIVDQTVGIRPATIDRKPFIGMHPKYQHVGIFNGLGAKGVSLAPYFSKQFTEVLEGKRELDSEVNINRYKSLY